MNSGTTFDFSSFNSVPTNDLFGRNNQGAEPSYLPTGTSFPQPPHTYNNQGTYMQQELSIYKEQCSMLEKELLKVRAERDMTKSLFDQLTARMGSGAPTPTVKTQDNYLKVRFWHQEVFAKWTTTAEATMKTHWKLAYLEDEQGETISESTLKLLRKKIKSAWNDLAMNKSAPKQWGKASASAKEYVYDIVYKHFPFMELAKNDWKMDDLCSLDYPGWVRNNTDTSRNWVDSKVVKNEDDSSIGETSLTGPSRKRKGKELKSEQTEKKPKGDSDEDQETPVESEVDSPSSFTLSSPVETMPFSVPSPPVPSGSLSPPSDSVPLPSLAASSMSSLSSIIEDHPEMLVEQGTVMDIGSIEQGTTANREIAMTTNEERGANKEMATMTNKETGASKERVGEVVMNPLNMLLKSVLKIKIPPLPPIPVSADKSSTGVQRSSKGDVIIENNGTTTRAVDDKNKERKMRIQKNKTPYYLCARHWLKQVNQTGTSEQFRHYWYKMLSNTQRDVYKKECAEIIAKDAWNDDICNGTIH